MGNAAGTAGADGHVGVVGPAVKNEPTSLHTYWSRYWCSFGGTFLLVRFTGSEERTPDAPWLFHIDDDAINHIVATHIGQTVTYEKKPGSLKWFILEDPELPVNFEKWSGTPLLLSGPRVNRVLLDTIDDPAPYGLDPPETSVKVTARSARASSFTWGSPPQTGPIPTRGWWDSPNCSRFPLPGPR